VLATGNNDSIVGKLIARYCHFLNLGHLALDVNQRLGFPLARLALYQELSDEDLEKEELKTIRNVGTGICYTLSAYLLTFKKNFGFRLNSALIASSIIARGILTVIGWRTGVVGVFEDALAKGEDGKVQRYVLKQRVSGSLIVALTTIGICCSSKEEGESCCLPQEIPQAVLKPVAFMEDVVKKFVFFAQQVF